MGFSIQTFAPSRAQGMSYWQNKVAVVTGGSSGLGLALSHALFAAGATVVMAARNAEQLKAAADGVRLGKDAPENPSTLKGSGIERRSAIGVPTDITSDSQVEALIGTTLDRFGQLDALINCAGRSARGDILATTPAAFQELWELNFLSLVRCTRAAAPHLIKTGGHLVNIGSLASKSASKYLAAYPATKFAVAAYTQQLRLELGPQGLHTLLVCPGPIRRDSHEDRYSDQTGSLPAAARKAGGGVHLKGIDPAWLSTRILCACERRKAELVIPARSRLLFSIAQLSPSWGDWILRRMTGG